VRQWCGKAVPTFAQADCSELVYVTADSRQPKVHLSVRLYYIAWIKAHSYRSHILDFFWLLGAKAALAPVNKRLMMLGR
jgi:hypothetical protein